MGISQEDLEGRLEVSVFPPVYLNLRDAEDTYSKACEKVDLVIIDALKGATPGADENDSKIRDCIDTLSRVSERTGTAFLIIHHSGKPKDSHGDGRMVPRGSSAIFDACGSVLVMTGEKGKPKKVSHEKGAAEAEGGVTEDFCLAIEDVSVGNNPRAGVRIVYMTMEQAGLSEEAGARFDALKEKILAVVRKHGTLESKNAICERVDGASKTTKLTAIQELLDRGQLVIINKRFRAA
ncbi:AAA family ATPase [Sorangium sp. So ce1128]